MIHDLTYGLRALRRSKAMTFTAIAALALGIGANTALFTVLNAVLLRPMNYPHAERIVEVTRNYGGDTNVAAVTPTKFDFWRRENHSFEAIAAINFLSVGMNLAGHNEPERLTSLPVSADFFRVLGVQPWIGRSFSEAQDKPGAGHFAVISYSLWQRLFQSDVNAIGRGLWLNDANYTVVGVMPARFDFPQAADLWTPLQLKIDPTDHGNDYAVIARLKPGETVTQAAGDMRMVGQRFRKQFGRGIMMDDKETVAVLSFHDWTVGAVRSVLLVLMGAVGFVLLIACSNVASLLLARSVLRQREIAVRTALGASPGQLVRLLLAESLLLSFAGGSVGILLAQLALPFLLALAPGSLPLLSGTGISWQVILFAFGLVIATGLIFGLFPAFHSIRVGISPALREASRTTSHASANRAHQILVVVEVAVSLLLLVGAGLLTQTFKNLTGVDPGFSTRNVLTMQMSLTAERFRTTAATAALLQRIVTRLETIPGVGAAGTISTLPTEPGFDDPFEIVGRRFTDTMDEDFRIVTPHYFSALQIPVVAGRAFTEQDTRQSRAVIIINATLARKYFPKENPLGQQILVGRAMGPMFADLPRTIVGVVGDTRDGGLATEAKPIYFEPTAQLPDSLMALDNQLISINWVIRTSGEPMALAETIRRETLASSGGVPMADPRALEQVIGNSIARERFGMTLLGIFAGLAVLLGGVGLYGVIAYSVAQRTRELGIRAALGAGRADLAKMVIGKGMGLVATGVLLGLVAAWGLTRFLRGMLYGVSSFEPSVLVLVTGFLLCVAVLACWLPARRASRIDPLIALRDE